MNNDVINITMWIGAEGRLFERASEVFRILGYQIPKPDVEGGDGAYLMNIMNQYRADLTEEEVGWIVEFARTMTLASLKTMERGHLEIARGMVTYAT